MASKPNENFVFKKNPSFMQNRYSKVELLGLISMARKGNQGAFAKLFDHYQLRIFGTVNHIFNDRETAQAITRRVFESIYLDDPTLDTKDHYIKSITDPDSFVLGYARKITLDTLKDLLNYRIRQLTND